MKLSGKELLARLGAGESIDSLCKEAALTQPEFQSWWRTEIRSRVPEMSGTRSVPVRNEVLIERNAQGIPRIIANSDEDLFFGFGYAMAQDRLFQLDYLRRRASGRLSEILGAEGLELDLVARTIGLQRIAELEWMELPEETRRLTEHFCQGINQWIADSQDQVAIEFDLLDYRPDPWKPVDCLGIAVEFRWYLTGRFPVICIPEAAKRKLHSESLYQAFLTPEADDECILPANSYSPRASSSQLAGEIVGDPQAAEGSNNWVIAGSRTVSGLPIVASDPHIAMSAVSVWYEVHLQGGSFNVAGMSYVGMPAVMFGRNSHLAWGITNNICSLRDLYLEEVSPDHPDSFLFNDNWERATLTEEVIFVRGAGATRKQIRSSRNGPIVNDILPFYAQNFGPVSLKWQGQTPCGWMTSLLNMGRAENVQQLRKTMEPWAVPTFSIVMADVQGQIAYQCVGRIPIRKSYERGFRPGWDPQHQWQGHIPYQHMPAVENPIDGIVVTANNRVALDDFPYPLSGTWVSGQRARRIRELLISKTRMTTQDSAEIQQDALSLRAQNCVPCLVDILRSSNDSRVLAATEHLKAWDCRVEIDRIGATLFNVFFARWSVRIAAEYFDKVTAESFGPAIGGLAARLLKQDDVNWFQTRSAQDVARWVFVETLDWLTSRLGTSMLEWGWGRLHTLQLRHYLSSRGDLRKLLDCGGIPVKGDGVTVCNTGADPQFAAMMGAGYRMIADLADRAGALKAIDVSSQSGHPGSPHYQDQIPEWNYGSYHKLVLDSQAGTECSGVKEGAAIPLTLLRLLPRGN